MEELDSILVEALDMAFSSSTNFEIHLTNPFMLSSHSSLLRLQSMPFKVGQRIWIACDVKAGMFPKERSIRFELPAPEKRIVSGFVPERFVKPRSNTLPARVAAVVASPPEKGKVRVFLPGEVLTSTNPFLVATSWLKAHAP